jgi:hypothetical protein
MKIDENPETGFFLLIRAASGLLPDVMATSTSRAQASASDFRRKQPETCCPLRPTWARHLPEGSLLNDAMPWSYI